VEGRFARGMTVAVIDPDGREIAHGLTSYDAEAIERLIGVRSNQIEALLGYSYGDAVIHRNNMIVLS
jgi:glutamate 5-kinase